MAVLVTFFASNVSVEANVNDCRHVNGPPNGCAIAGNPLLAWPYARLLRLWRESDQTVHHLAAQIPQSRHIEQ
jgi:hypothetical protein